MSQDERQRVKLYELLEASMGREATVHLLEALPPAGQPLATAAQLTAVKQRMDDRFTTVEQRMDDRFTAVEQRMDERFTAVEQRMDDRFTAVEQRMDDRVTAVDERFIALEHRIDDRMAALSSELLAAFRGELVTAVSGQARMTIVAIVTVVLSIGGLAQILQ